jgi:hypothetical protein
MGEDWSQEEVEATVANYFSMLDKELRGQNYNKTEHRHRLAVLLNNRSDGAIERKNQNISAILIKLGFPYISGYKPLGNYQQLLNDIVSDRLENNRRLIDIVKRQVIQPAKMPDLDDILAAFVNPPTMELTSCSNAESRVREPSIRFNVDYLVQEARNRSLGVAGEEFVIHYEQARLIHAGKENLASKVEHVSLTHGDNFGFDVLSFESTGQERLIEVKTTAYGSLTPFYVTRNEVEVSQKNASSYYLYRTFDFRRRVKMFAKQGPLDQSFKLNPKEYLASLD